jgi:hypothetical protein
MSLEGLSSVLYRWREANNPNVMYVILGALI